MQQIPISLSISGQKLNHLFQFHRCRRLISTSVIPICFPDSTNIKGAMVTASSSPSSSNPNNNRGGSEFTTLKERITFEKEIKKSKFIAIAGPVSDERSAFTFLSEVINN